ncbi:hypothetical protein MRB53_037895 [Persea americana]|nr:hypothetical protein MRB53_037895 [Persea americana]
MSRLPRVAIRRYLLLKVQHLVAGGFSKYPDDPPDIYHSYLGLAALALLDEGVGNGEDEQGSDVGEGAGGIRLTPTKTLEPADADPEAGPREAAASDRGPRKVRMLAKLDPALCFSVRARQWVEGLSWTDEDAQS